MEWIRVLPVVVVLAYQQQHEGYIHSALTPSSRTVFATPLMYAYGHLQWNRGLTAVLDARDLPLYWIFSHTGWQDDEEGMHQARVNE